jgi:hypothetical protein
MVAAPGSAATNFNEMTIAVRGRRSPGEDPGRGGRLLRSYVRARVLEPASVVITLRGAPSRNR